MNTFASSRLSPSLPLTRLSFSVHLALCIVLTLLLSVLMLMPDMGLFSSVADYLTFHNLFELLSIGVAMMVFLLVCSLPRSPLDWHLVMLGCGFLAVGLSDLGHTMARRAFAAKPFRRQALAQKLREVLDQ